MSTPINMSSGLPETVLPALPPELASALANATSRDDIAAFVAAHPRIMAGWGALGDAVNDPVERYAYYRVGYHRGLDALRGSGWRGSGYVRWSHPSNQGFLRCLLGLGHMAAHIGETDEAQRCVQFLQQLDPGGVPKNVVG